jgi:hypothetical protein
MRTTDSKRIPLAFLAACSALWLTAAVHAQTPTIVTAFGEFDSGTSNQFVEVTFSEAMNLDALDPHNYTVAGYTVLDAKFFVNNESVASPNTVILQLNSPLTNSFSLVVNNVQSVSGATIAAGASVAGTLDPLSSIDIGVFSLTGTTLYEGPGSYLVNASGQDIWNNQDGFRYVYTTRTNNFAVVVQVPYILPADQWSKAGLMAREAIDPSDGGSRMVAVFTTPLATQLGLDGTYGENSLSVAVRDTTDGGAYEPNDYIGDGAIAPVYPNQWLMLTRVTGGTNDLFTVYGSTNDADWIWLCNFDPVDTGASNAFPEVVFVGLCSSTDIYPPNNELVTASYQNFGDYVVHLFLTDSPTNTTVESGSSATFSVVAGADSSFSMNGVTSPFVSYQWYTNGVVVSGANASIYTIPLATTNLSGLQVYCAVNAISPFTGSTNSAKATLTVLENPAPPTIVTAFAEYDSGTSNQYVDVTFSEAMNASSITDPADYSIAGYTITNVMLFTNNLGVGSTNKVILELSKPLTNSFTLVVTNLQSFSSVPIAADTSAAGAVDRLNSIDIGIIDAPGADTTYYEGPGSYLVNSSGQDIWNDQDGFRFVYTTRTNNFAVVVQVPYILPADAWSKAGLMARETIDPSDGGSRMVAFFTTPSATQLGLDGTYGENSLSFQVRDTTDGGAYEPPVPTNYIGDGVIAPSYPNQWLLLTRATDGTNDAFTAYASTNEINWTWVGVFNPVTNGADTPFPPVVNVGMCTSSDIYPPLPVPPELATASYQNFGDYVDHVYLTNSPTNVTVESGTSATFSVLVGSDGTLSINGVTGLFANFQWYTNGVAVPGANASIYTTPLTTTNLNGEQIYCAISTVGGTTTNSAKATLTVVQNPAVPTILSAFGEYDSGSSLQYVDITFSEPMNLASILNPANYFITGYTITSVELFTNNLGVGEATNVVLELSKQITGNFTLNVTNIQSISSIPIAANTSIATTEDPLSSIDIGVIDFPGTGATYYEGPGSYLVNSSGQDIWNDQDGFRYVYGTRTNNFNIVVQVPFILAADTWSKAGLMARETIDPADGGSRMVAVVTTALATQLGLDGAYGENSLSMIVRDTTDQGAYEPAVPADYVGDGTIAPSYPNQWLLLTRRTDGTNDLFTAYASTNETDWTWVGDFNPVDTGASNAFPGVVNVGMASSSDIYPALPTTPELVTAMYENFGDYVGHDVFLTNSPQSVTVESGTSATFSVLVGSDSTLLYKGATTPFVTYQWYTNGVPVPGATADIYTTPATTTNLNGEQVYCAITPIGGAAATNSAKAALTVLEDTAPPTIVSAFAEYDQGASNQYVDVTFSKIMNVASLLNPTNYSIAGYTITGVRLYTNDLGVGSTTMVILQLNKPLTGSFTLDVNNVQSISSIPIAADTSVAATADPLSSIDIGVFSLRGTTYYEGPALTWSIPVDRTSGMTRTASVSFTPPEPTTLTSSSRCPLSSQPTHGARPA